MKNKYGLLKVLLVLLCFVIAGIIYSCVSQNDPDDTEISSVETGETQADIINETETEKLLCVHVCGSVNDPGVYYLPEDSRVHQAVEQAGGFTADADDSLVNLADVVTDGEQIYIPSVQEIENGEYSVPDLTRNNGADTRVNINTAGVSELSTLAGIGESKAEAIIAYRENVSLFEDPEDIINVSGIGESIYEKIKDSIKVK